MSFNNAATSDMVPGELEKSASGMHTGRKDRKTAEVWPKMFTLTNNA
jgi:hypothetical protein